MLVEAIHLGGRLNLRDLPSKLGMKVMQKDPLIIEYNENHLVLLKYGVVVFWGFERSEKNKIIHQLMEFLTERFDHPFEEEIEVKIQNNAPGTDEEGLKINELTPENISVVSLILGRSVALDHYDHEVQKVLTDFANITQSFAQKGHTRTSSKKLLKKVGFAINIQHNIVAGMAFLDKPDITWDDPALDRFYQDLLAYYEIEERFAILNQKLNMIVSNVQFIVDFLNTRRSTLLEVMIVILFVIDIVLIGFQEFK